MTIDKILAACLALLCWTVSLAILQAAGAKHRAKKIPFLVLTCAAASTPFLIFADPVAISAERPFIAGAVGLIALALVSLFCSIFTGAPQLVRKWARCVVAPSMGFIITGSGHWELLTWRKYPLSALLIVLGGLGVLYSLWKKSRRPTSILRLAGWRHVLRQYGKTFAGHFLATGFPEEYLYRFFLLTVLSGMLGPFTALVISSALFGGAHFSMKKGMSLPGAIASAVLTQGSVGLVLGVAFMYTGSLWVPVLLHAAYNAVLHIDATLASTYFKRAAKERGDANESCCGIKNTAAKADGHRQGRNRTVY